MASPLCWLAEWLPRKAENLTPYTMALIAKYVARHRLREPRLLDTIANFLLKRGEQLDSKVSAALRLWARLGTAATALLHQGGAFQGTRGRAPVSAGSEHPCFRGTGQVAPTCPPSQPSPTRLSCRR